MALRPWEGGTSIWFAAAARRRWPCPRSDCTTLLHIAVARLTPIDQWQCLSRVPSFSPPRLYWRLGTHIQHPRSWRLPVPTRPCAAPACSPERSNNASRHPPSSTFDVSTQDDARSAKNFSYLSWTESVACTPPCHAIPAHQMHQPGREACPTTVHPCQSPTFAVSKPLTVCLPCPYVRAACNPDLQVQKKESVVQRPPCSYCVPASGCGRGSTEIYLCAPRPEGFQPRTPFPSVPRRPVSSYLVPPVCLCL